VKGVASNQVVLCLRLACLASGHQLLVATTHLKARSGPQLAAYRAEQGRDLANFLHELQRDSMGCALVLTGDFNAEPSEPVFQNLLGPLSTLQLTSAYR
jgi:endonuclease/exonuclease/phosphatase family metal-dependent hydrolase